MKLLWKKLNPFEKERQKPSGSLALIADHPVWMGYQDSYEEHAHNGYRRNSIVYRCVNLIAQCISSVKLCVQKDGQLVKDHPILKLLSNPNTLQTSYCDFMQTLISHLLLSGNAFIQLVGEELYILRPDRVKVLLGKDGFPAAYEYRVGTHCQRLTISDFSDVSSILHISLFNPLDAHWGQSPLTAASSLVSFRNQALEHNAAILENGGRPSGLLIVDTEQEMTAPQREQLREDLENLYAGRKNAGRMMVLEGKFRWETLGISPKDMDFLKGQEKSGREIAQVFGIPPVCIGIRSEHETFSSYKEARLHMWEDTLLPLLQYVLEHLNQWFFSLYGKEVHLTFNKDNIDALSVKRDELWDRVNKAEFLTINEKRSLLGLPHLSETQTSQLAYSSASA